MSEPTTDTTTTNDLRLAHSDACLRAVQAQRALQAADHALAQSEAFLAYIAAKQALEEAARAADEALAALEAAQ